MNEFELRVFKKKYPQYDIIGVVNVEFESEPGYESTIIYFKKFNRVCQESIQFSFSKKVNKERDRFKKINEIIQTQINYLAPVLNRDFRQYINDVNEVRLTLVLEDFIDSLAYISYPNCNKKDYYNELTDIVKEGIQAKNTHKQIYDIVLEKYNLKEEDVEKYIRSLSKTRRIKSKS